MPRKTDEGYEVADKTIDTLDEQGMVDQANALLDKNRELQAEIERLRAERDKYREAIVSGSWDAVAEKIFRAVKALKEQGDG